MSKRCPSCNEEIKERYVYCPSCGTKIESSDTNVGDELPQSPSNQLKAQYNQHHLEGGETSKSTYKKIIGGLALFVLACILVVVSKNTFGNGVDDSNVSLFSSKEQATAIKLDKLNGLILESSELDSNDYTDATWSVYEAALRRGEELYKSDDPAIEDVQTVTQNIETARDNLKLSKLAFKEMPYESVARYPEKYEGKLMKITGEVHQSGDDMLRVATKLEDYGFIGEKYMNDVVFVFMNNDTIRDGRVLEGDLVTVYGKCDGVTTYETINGGHITIPALYAMEIDNQSIN